MKLRYKYLQALIVSTLVVLGCNEDSNQNHSIQDDSKCGNGILEGGEACDDGNSQNNDGCSADCMTVEDDYVCETEGELCRKVDVPECGNSILEGDEACDDGNTDDGDGCRADCSEIEDDYTCEKAGELCSRKQEAKCGNGVIEGDEACDDGNTNDGDGCRADCSAIEDDYTCKKAGELCSKTNEAKCGNGIIEDGEACDDGNEFDNDGCRADCLIIEDGYSCETEGLPCQKNAECGNGLIENDEACDDGNTEAGDGCSADCLSIENGYVCKTEGLACEKRKAECGDGLIEGRELCDDGNLEDGDGCSAVCTQEEGYVCKNSGRLCVNQEDIPEDEESVCGDGFISGNEMCDDGNTESGDGCSADCLLVEIGYDCRNSGRACVIALPDMECGNGILEAGETCDDSNTNDGDGCSSACQIESGWTCVGSTCSTICGDGIIAGTETCDDGNTISNDGCSSSCEIESGWVCSRPGESCTPRGADEICGDGILTASEACDDNNNNNGDGCSSSCQIESGWTCSGTTCTTTCGDGIKAGRETCDDRNTANGDGCSSSCQIESGWTCTTVGAPCTKIPVVTKKSISILAIGNSFSQDAMTYLYDVLAAVGYEDITIANLYYSGCSLAEHVSFIKGDTNDYTFQVHSNLDGGSLITVDSFKASDAFNFTGKFNNKVLTGYYGNQTLKGLDNGWDYISVQQSSPLGGIASSYILDSSGTGKNDINYIIDKAKAKSSKAKIIWHMPWAFQAGSVRKQFVYYGKDQLKMYNTTVNTTKEQILTNSKINIIIPAGTAIQNLRTSIIGDNLTRDGYHLSKSQGRLALAMMWVKQITGENISSITTASLYNHNGVASKNLETAYKPLYTDRMIAAIKKAVNDAYSNPFVVTPATEGISETTYKPNTELQRIFTNAGYNLNNYQELPFGVIKNAYYNASSSSAAICNITNIDNNCSSILVSAETGGTSTSLLNSIAATRIFNRYELPVGSVIVLKDGYQYRPEAWTEYNTTVSSSDRPAMVTTQIVPITTSWWGDFKYRAFNISKKGRPELSASEMNSLSSALAIFVPKESVNTDKVLKDKGYDPSKYKKLDLELLNDGYWNPTTAYSWTGTINNNRFPTYITRSYEKTSAYATTKIFTKSDLPNGTLIVAAPGYQYRPDGWITLSKEISSSSRPDMVKTTTSTGSVVTVNSTWWGSFNYRVFNLSQLDKPKLNYLEQYKFNDKFAIYVPK